MGSRLQPFIGKFRTEEYHLTFKTLSNYYLSKQMKEQEIKDRVKGENWNIETYSERGK